MVCASTMYTRTDEPPSYVMCKFNHDAEQGGFDMNISSADLDVYFAKFPESQCRTISGCEEMDIFQEALQSAFLKQSCTLRKDHSHCTLEVPNLGTFTVHKMMSGREEGEDERERRVLKMQTDMLSTVVRFAKFASNRDTEKMVSSATSKEKRSREELKKVTSGMESAKEAFIAMRREHEHTLQSLMKVPLPPDRSNEIHTVDGNVRNPLGKGVFCKAYDVDLMRMLKTYMVEKAKAAKHASTSSSRSEEDEDSTEDSDDEGTAAEAFECLSTEEWSALVSELQQINVDEAAAADQSAPSGMTLSESFRGRRCMAHVFQAIQSLGEWDFNIFKLQESMTGSFLHEGLMSQPKGGSLFTVVFALFHSHNLFKKFSIDEQTLVNWASVVEAGYHPNPYHNSMHAADVLHVTNYVIMHGGLRDSVQLRDDDILASLFAATIHDYNHPGINNNYHVKAQSYLATLFNDKSVLENVHVSSVFELMKIPQFDIFKNIGEERKRNLKETVTEMVLATDMVLHAKILSSFKRKAADGSKLTKREDIRLALSMVMKLADISNCTRPHHLYVNWCNHITDEFYLQGDRERALGHPVSPFMDRYNPTVAKGQMAFMSYIVLPLFECMSEYLPLIKFTIDLCHQNKDYWANRRANTNPTHAE